MARTLPEVRRGRKADGPRRGYWARATRTRSLPRPSRSLSTSHGWQHTAQSSTYEPRVSGST